METREEKVLFVFLTILVLPRADSALGTGNVKPIVASG